VMCDYDALYQVLEEHRALYSPNNEIQSLFEALAQKLCDERGGEKQEP